MKLPRSTAFLLVAMVHAAPVVAQGQPGRTTGAALDMETKCAIGRWGGCDVGQAQAKGLFETGLSPRFPDNAKCHGIDEGYAVSYTSRRDKEAYHGGIDMPAAQGTPIIAAAAGTVVAKYGGEASYRGIEIVLRHSPEDTGLPLWIYTQYGHCAEMPAQATGQRVGRGEKLCPTGNTGITQGRKTRRPAIHFGVFYSASEQYADIRETIIPMNGYWMDPVALYRKKLPLDSATLKALLEAEKKVAIPIMFEDGEPLPADTKLVWPYACARK